MFVNRNCYNSITIDSTEPQNGAKCFFYIVKYVNCLPNSGSSDKLIWNIYGYVSKICIESDLIFLLNACKHYQVNLCLD